MNNYKINKLFQDSKEDNQFTLLKSIEYYEYIALTILNKYNMNKFEKEEIFILSMNKFLNSIYTSFDNSHFISFAIKIILSEIKSYNIQQINFNNYKNKKKVYISILKAKDTLKYTLNRSPKISEISNYINTPEETILEIIEMFNDNAYFKENLVSC